MQRQEQRQRKTKRDDYNMSPQKSSSPRQEEDEDEEEFTGQLVMGEGVDSEIKMTRDVRQESDSKGLEIQSWIQSRGSKDTRIWFGYFPRKKSTCSFLSRNTLVLSKVWLF